MASLRLLRFLRLLVLPVLLLSPDRPAGAAGAAAPPPREIRLEVVVDAPPEKVYEAWMNPEAVKRFFAPDSRIEPRVGGTYEMIFDPESDPEGALLGTKGAKLLALEPGRRIAFEWKGRPDMPEMNVQPFPTWVEILLKPAPGRPGGTAVELVHHGFGDGGQWDLAYSFFKDSAWPQVLQGLQEHFQSRSAEGADAPPSQP